MQECCESVRALTLVVGIIVGLGIYFVLCFIIGKASSLGAWR